LRIATPIWIILLTLITGSAQCQKQLVLIKKENVLLRLYPGDEFIYRLKGSKTVRTTYVNNISDSAVVTHRDTVPYRMIDRLYYPQRRFYNTIGSALVVGGAGLFLIDQFNVVVINNQSASLDDQVTAVTLSSLAVGIPLMLYKKKFRKLTYGTRLMMVDKGSAFYRPDTREQIN
jgi:hypothetical protein